MPTLKASQGGDLITSPSAEAGGLKNFGIRRDWRKDLTDWVRREGDTFFWVVEPIGEQPYPSGNDEEEINAFYTGRRPNGQIALFAASKTKLWRFFALEDGRYFDDGYVDDDYVGDIEGDWIVIASGLSPTHGHRWEILDIDGWVIFNNDADLPLSYRLEHFEARPIYEMREQGFAHVGTIVNYNGILMCADVSEIIPSELADIMNGLDPYGRIDGALLKNRVQYRVIWSHAGEPTRWATIVPGTINAGSASLTLAYPVESFDVGDEIIIAGAAALGNNLVATILNISGTAVLLSAAASVSVANAAVQKKDAAGMIVGYSDFMQDDGSAVLRMMVLKNTLVILKDTAFYIGAYTGNPDDPFVFERVHADRESEQTLFYRWGCMVISGDYILYPGRKRFYRFDLTRLRPVEHPKLILCENLFYDHVEPEDIDDVFGALNGVTGEVWFTFNGPTDKVLVYDYKHDECHTIAGYGYTAAATIKKPVVGIQIGPSEDWFLVASPNGTVLRYGKTNRTSDDDVFTRIDAEGEPQTYTSALRSNLGAAGQEFNETVNLAYDVLVSSKSPGETFTIRLFQARSPAEAATLLGSREITSRDETLTPVHMLAQYVQDEILATGEQQLKIAGRIYGKLGEVQSGGVARNE